MPEELWMEVQNTVQEKITKTKPNQRKSKKAKGCLRIPDSRAEKENQSQRRKRKIYPTECRVPENSKDREQSLLK